MCMESEFARRVMSRKGRGMAEDMEYLCSNATKGQWEAIITKSKVGLSIKSRTENVQGVVGKYLRTFHDSSKNGNKVNLLCLGCGVGREVVYPLSKMREEQRLSKMVCTCIDIDPVAISLSKALAKENGIGKSIDYIEADVVNLRRLVGGGRISKSDVVVEVGLHEYREEPDMRAWINYYINDALNSGGVYITSSMRSHWGLPRLTIDAMGWKLIYKDLKKTVNIINESGLQVIESFYEPFGMHGIVVARKR
jgi:SAM-dependent methyltransferase